MHINEHYATIHMHKLISLKLILQKIIHHKIHVLKILYNERKILQSDHQ